jgi:hypothetical protein
MTIKRKQTLNLFLFLLIGFAGTGYYISCVSSGKLTDEQIRMSGWRVHGLLGKVKSVKYSTGETLDFNADGNLISGGRQYENPSRYTWEGDIYDILFPDRNTRYDKWYSGTSEDIGITYRFDAQGRIVEAGNGLNYSLDIVKYVYAGQDDKFPSSVIYTNGDDVESRCTTYTYVYVSTDDTGNWTKRNVQKTVEDEYFDTGEKKIISTTSETETAEYVYF